MAIDFPNTPSTGQTFTVGDRTWSYDGTKWNTVSTGNSGVRVFANAASRDTTIPAPTEGMYSYQQDSNDTTFYNGSAWETTYGKNRNVVINGGFDYWQRGTSFTAPAGSYTADRWIGAGFSGSETITQQTFTPGAAPVAGYEGQYFARLGIGATAGSRYFYQKVEDVRTLAGQTATLSFWARVSTGTITFTSVVGNQNFGTGGSAFNGGIAQNNTLTTTWQRFTHTANIASVAGKTIGPGSNLEAGAFYTTATNVNIDIWGVQLEAGSVATPFSRAGGTLQGEKAACQRYYWRATALGSNDGILPTGTALSSTQVIIHGFHPTSMRTYTSSFDFSNIRLFDGVTVFAVTAVTSSFANPDTYALILTCAGGLTQYRPYVVLANAGTSYFGANAEL